MYQYVTFEIKKCFSYLCPYVYGFLLDKDKDKDKPIFGMVTKSEIALYIYVILKELIYQYYRTVRMSC